MRLIVDEITMANFPVKAEQLEAGTSCRVRDGKDFHDGTIVTFGDKKDVSNAAGDIEKIEKKSAENMEKESDKNMEKQSAKSTTEFTTKKKPKIKKERKVKKQENLQREKRQIPVKEFCHSPPPLPQPLALVEHKTQAACSTETGRYSATYINSNRSTLSAPSACNLPQHTDPVTPTNEPVKAISTNTTVHTGNRRKIDFNAPLLNPDTVINIYPKL
uniref:Uncharacterized protein n=1 Tax=Amphimedon queenslandica TaxID=400682 RepID=A0A1X7U0Z7_AMPQE